MAIIFAGVRTYTIVKSLQKAGYLVIPYTINEMDDMRRIIALGVDGIITDRPDLLNEVMVEEGIDPVRFPDQIALADPSNYTMPSDVTDFKNMEDISASLEVPEWVGGAYDGTVLFVAERN